MTDLSTKFAALETQTAARHDAIMLALGNITTALGNIATALGTPPATPTTTLQDVVDVLNLQRQTLADIHLDTISLDQKLLRIRDAISPLGEALPTETKSSMVWTLYRLMDAIQPTWPRATSTPILQALNLIYGLEVLNRPDIAAIKAAMGTPTGDATTTALGLITSVQYSNTKLLESSGISLGSTDNILDKLDSLVDCGCTAIAPLTGDCTHPFNSSGMVIVPLSITGISSNVIAATFVGPLPEGITFGSTFGWGTDSTELNCSTWSSWAVFVGSTESQYAEGPFTTERFPTNTWRIMSGSGPKAFSVSAGGGITVQLCRTINRISYVAPCFDGTSLAYTQTGGPGSGATGFVVNWASHSVAAVNTIRDGNNTLYTYSIPVVAGTNFNGWTLTSSKVTYVQYVNADKGGRQVTVQANTPYVLAGTEPKTMIYASSTFTYSLCPPAS